MTRPVAAQLTSPDQVDQFAGAMRELLGGVSILIVASSEDAGIGVESKGLLSSAVETLEAIGSIFEALVTTSRRFSLAADRLGLTEDLSREVEAIIAAEESVH